MAHHSAHEEHFQLDRMSRHAGLNLTPLAGKTVLDLEVLQTFFMPLGA
jgi:hypothetical protein